jgi:hypothetical protein
MKVKYFHTDLHKLRCLIWHKFTCRCEFSYNDGLGFLFFFFSEGKFPHYCGCITFVFRHLEKSYVRRDVLYFVCNTVGVFLN